MTKKDGNLPGIIRSRGRASSALQAIGVQPLFFPQSLPYQISNIPDATPQNAGVMTPAQAAKLDSLPDIPQPTVIGTVLMYTANGLEWVLLSFPTPQIFDCPSSAQVGDPVYEVADLVVAEADAATTAAAPALGMISSKPTATTCTIVQVGPLAVPYPLPADGTALFLAVGGGVTASAPTGSGNVVQGLAEVISQSGRILQVHVDPENFVLRA